MRTEGTPDDPDAFLQEVIEEKIADLARRIEKELAKGIEADGEEVSRLTAARAKFSEILRSPRIYLAGAPERESGPARIQPLRPIVPARETGAPSPPPVAPAAPTARPAGVGQMRAFLESLRTGAPAPTQAGKERPEAAPAAAGPAPAAASARAASAPAAGPPDDVGAIRRDVVESLKRRAASQGFSDVYELLRYKRDRIQESLKNLVSSRAAVPLIQSLRKDLKEIERLLAADLESVVQGVAEFDEVAGVDKGRLGDLRKEMAGLMREIG